MRILIAGYNVRHIACSAARAGHEIFAADSFCDLDLEGCSKSVVILPHTLNVSQSERFIQTYMKEIIPDAVVLGSGLEEAKVAGVRVLNNPLKKAAAVSDKLWMARWLEMKGYPFIRTGESWEDVSFPAIIKPRKGAGGIGCKMIRNAEDLNLCDGLIFQDWIDGMPASVSVIANGRDSLAIAANEQLIGASWTGADDFRYCGNITPLEPQQSEIAEMAEEIVSELGLIGSNGVDFLLTKRGPVVVEVNPRFQGSLDSVELSTGINIFKAHADAFDGILPDKPLSKKSVGRSILFTRKSIEMSDKASALIARENWTCDVPRPGTKINIGDPVASVMAAGQSREDVLRLLIERTAYLQKTLG